MRTKPIKSNRLPACVLAVLLSSGVASSFAASNTFTLTASDASTLSSFTTWNVSGGGSAAPAAGTGGDTNDYFTGAFVLRTPTSGDNTFAGDSLTVQTGGQFAIKGAVGSTLTVNNLILDGGQLNVASGTSSGSPVFNVAGNITVTSNGGLLRAFSNGSSGSSSKQVLNITAAISGSGPLSIDYNSGSSNSKGTIRLSAANSYSGELKVLNSPYTTALQLNNLDALKYATLTVENTGATGVGFNAGAGTYNVGALQGAVTTGTIATSTGIILSVGSKNTTTAFSGVISGAGSLAKVGTGTLTLSGANSYSGGTTVSQGTLALGASEVLANTGALTLSGGTFAQGAGFTETLGALNLTANSIVTLGDASSKLIFADSSASWGSNTLSITGTFVSGSSIGFGSSSGIGANLGLISIAGFTNIGIDGNGFLTATSAIPEPDTYAALAGLVILGFATRRRRA